ncbi:MAG: electron transfer flavoprotein subunit alpha/FixB family protein [Candidatus Cloacimonadota bacterium]|nr:MAG: electron transfer flavoprotein subunit alpha/FixB family protein [Candidatus Cloacimonadota bacterium]
MTKDIFVIVEHRRGEVRDITFELLTKGYELSRDRGKLLAVLLGFQNEKIIDKLKPFAETILNIDDERLKEFNAEYYQIVLSNLLQEKKPFITLLGQTAFGIDFAPSLSTAIDLPYSSDCLDLEIENDTVFTERQIYGGKINSRISLAENWGYLVSVRPGSIAPRDVELVAEVVDVSSPIKEDIDYRKFMQYVEAAKGEVDITQSEVVIGIGRGIKEDKNLSMMEDFAKSIGGVLACSRPVVDAGWLTKDRQVGSSGKTVKPKLYIAVGISGAFQHVMGMKGADTIVAINKDPNAPIFTVANYGIVGDLLQVIPKLNEKITELKGA